MYVDRHPKKVIRKEPLVTEAGRLCIACRKRHPLDAFGIDRRYHDGRCKYCRKCAREKWKHWASKNPERVRDAARGVSRRAREADPEKQKLALRSSRLKCKYGITLKEFLGLIEAQGGRCLICTAEMVPRAQGRDKRALLACVDHDHSTGKIRGVLCNNCNRGLGLFGEDVLRLRLAAEDLEAHK